ncbi:MAG: hypothetical protein JNK86_04905, partial [Alphaproteobacteria bacterium]|nr:hypothetical protein [Alphaproteobacteria bacterium]
DRQYLVTYLGGEGIDLLKITLALLPSEAQLLMSVHNMGVDSENHPAIPKVFLDPRIYSISIP